MTNPRPFDIVVYGATGFTGKLVAQYLAEHGPSELRWAIAGRNRTKLEAVRDGVKAATGVVPAVIEADANEYSSLVKMAELGKVVLTTVGPYINYGESLVRACIEAGSHYVDITGEPEFVDSMYVQYHAAAQAANVRIVNCCGFDSIPHDLGALYTVRQLPDGVPLQVQGFVRSNGTFSGGTWNSALEAFGRARQSVSVQKERRNAEAKPEGRRVRAFKPKVFYQESLSSWACPLPTIDPQIVRRSARGLAEYGPDFQYGHYARVRSLPTIVGGVAGIGGLFALAQLPPARRFLQSLKKSGAGPTEAQRQKAWFNVTFIGRGGGCEVVTEVAGGDPGYGETSKMIAESALCLALDGDKLPEASGVITTAIAMGTPLLERLNRAGITFRMVKGEELSAASPRPKSETNPKQGRTG